MVWVTIKCLYTYAPTHCRQDHDQELDPALRYSVARDFFDTLALFSKVGVNAPVSLALGICCNFQGCKQLMGLQEPPPPRHCILICGLRVGYGVDGASRKQMTTASGCGLVLKTRVVVHADTLSGN